MKNDDDRHSDEKLHDECDLCKIKFVNQSLDEKREERFSLIRPETILSEQK